IPTVAAASQKGRQFTTPCPLFKLIIDDSKKTFNTTFVTLMYAVMIQDRMLITPDALILAKALLEKYNSKVTNLLARCQRSRTALQCHRQRLNTWRYLTEHQLADMFTKALPKDRFKYLVRRIGMRCFTPAEMEVLAKESA
nr:ribonuclease H-like domain-containing protein [Tanacetum cinerariifolium]